jgi:hypothetical protein
MPSPVWLGIEPAMFIGEAASDYEYHSEEIYDEGLSGIEQTTSNTETVSTGKRKTEHVKGACRRKRQRISEDNSKIYKSTNPPKTRGTVLWRKDLEAPDLKYPIVGFEEGEQTILLKDWKTRVATTQTSLELDLGNEADVEDNVQDVDSDTKTETPVHTIISNGIKDEVAVDPEPPPTTIIPEIKASELENTVKAVESVEPLIISKENRVVLPSLRKGHT